MVGVRCPSLRAPINTEGENTKNRRKDFLKETKKKNRRGEFERRVFGVRKKQKEILRRKPGRLERIKEEDCFES